jgi:membrane fusion protein, multidrug efflux system
MLSATAKLTRQNRPLWAGQSVRVRLEYGKQERALLVPLRAIRNNQNGPYLYIVKEDNTVELCTVSLGLEEKGEVIIEKGIEEVKKVVVEGHLRLFPGSKVEEVR